MSIEHHLLTDWFTHLSWYQYLGELIAILLYLLTFTSEKLIHFPKKLNFKLWRNFIRQSSFLLAFACISIPWLISGIF